MNRLVKLVGIIALCAWLFTGCALPQPATPDPAGLAPTAVTPPANSIHTPLPSIEGSALPPTGQAQPSPTEPGTPLSSTSVPASGARSRTHYELEAVLDYFSHSVSVTETISYTNPVTTSLTDLLLVIEPNYWSGCFNLVSLTWQNGQPVQGYVLDKAHLQVPLPDPLNEGDSLGLSLVYQLVLPEIPAPSEDVRPVPFGYSARQVNLVDWYAYVPPFQVGKGWLAHPRWGFGEHQVYDVGDYDVQLSLAEPVEDLEIAASAPAAQVGNTNHYHLDAARSFAISASNEYLVQSAEVGDVTVYSYSFPYDQASGQQALTDTVKAVELFSRLLAPYPHTTLSVVEADFLDGMEYDGLYFLSRGFYNLYDGTPQGYLTFIAAHETAHQWWYGLVGNDQALEPWLDEAMCTYMEHIFYEQAYTDYQTSSGESLLDWWWYYRVDYYDPSAWVDESLYDFALFRPYRDAIYLNGAKFLDDLRSTIGDQAFFDFLKDYASTEKYKITSADDFFSILKHHTSKNLDALMETYFQNSH